MSAANWVWQALADDSADHRNPDDADVVAVLSACRHDAELDRLYGERRDLHSRWDAVR